MIALGDKEIKDIRLGNKKITKVYLGKKLVWPVIKGDIGPTHVQEYIIDESISDPARMVTGEFGKDGNPETNIISWIRFNSHRYVGTYNTELGMVLKQLDDNNSELYADGTDASEDIKGVNGGDVFMKMPDFWFRGETLDDNRTKMLFTVQEPNDGNEWVKWDGNTLIGVYKAVCEDITNNANGVIYSRSGSTPTKKVSCQNFKDKARNRSNNNDHFMIVTYEAHQVMALLFITYYGNMNGQEVIGKGTTSSSKVTGQTNVDGMNDTIAENTRSINFWGLENWWGDLFEYMDNLVTADNSGTININNYDGETERQVKGYAAGSFYFITKMYLKEKLDLIPTILNGGSYTTYYCDDSRVHTSDNKVGRRCRNGGDVVDGPFCLSADTASSYSYDAIGSRLLYNGRITIENKETLSISSVSINPIASVMKVKSTRTISPITAKIVIKGKNLDKLDNTIQNLPEGIKISELSEGTTERTAVITSTITEDLDTLNLNLGGYNITINNPDKLPADLQYVYHNDKEVLKTGFEFHICDISDYSQLGSIKLYGLNINYEEIQGVTVDSQGNVTLPEFDKIYDRLAFDLNYRDNYIGTIIVHNATEEQVIEEDRERIESEMNSEQ